MTSNLWQFWCVNGPYIKAPRVRISWPTHRKSAKLQATSWTIPQQVMFHYTFKPCYVTYPEQDGKDSSVGILIKECECYTRECTEKAAGGKQRTTEQMWNRESTKHELDKNRPNLAVSGQTSRAHLLSKPSTCFPSHPPSILWFTFLPSSLIRDHHIP